MAVQDNGFFRSAFEHMLEGIQILGPDWTYLYLNPSAEVHNRRPNTELLGRRYADMWPGIAETHVYAVIGSCFAGGTAATLENRFVYPDGQVGWFELRIQPVPEGVLILSFDITARKQAEAQLGQVKRLYATLSEVNQAIVRLRDPLVLYRKICEVAVEFGGFALAWVGLLTETGDILPAEVRGLVKPRWPEVPVNIHRGPGRASLGVQAILSGKTTTSNNVRVNPDVSLFNDTLSAQDLRYGAAVPLRKSGKIAGILALARMEEGNFQSEEEIRLLTEIGLDILGLYRPEDREMVGRQIQEAQRNGYGTFEGTKVRDDGSTYEVSMEMVAVKDPEGQILYQVTTQVDITARKRTERLLKESEEHLQAIFHHSPAGIVMSRLNDGRIIEVNDAFARFHGYSPGEMLGRTSGELGLWAGETYSLGLAQDITDRKSLEAQLLQAQKIESLGTSMTSSVTPWNSSRPRSPKRWCSGWSPTGTCRPSKPILPWSTRSCSTSASTPGTRWIPREP